MRNWPEQDASSERWAQANLRSARGGHRRTDAQHRRAFTLIELLVVIAIIALLVSILLPSLNRAKDLARDAACAANADAISTAEQLYASEYDGHMTIVATGWDRGPGEDCPVDVHSWEQGRGILWYEILHAGGYTPSWEVFVDPADTNPPIDPTLQFISYGFNAYLGRGGQNYQLDDVARPQWTIMIPPNNAWGATHTGIWGYARPDAHRHTGYKAMYAFCDGHVEAITFAEMFDIEYNPEWSYEDHWTAARPDFASGHNWGWSPDTTAELFSHWCPWELGAEYNTWGHKQ